MNTDELKAKFREQINEAVDDYAKAVPDRDAPDLVECAFAAGMLLILSAFKAKDGPKLGLQIQVMHAALREVGQQRGWIVHRNR